MCHWEEGSGVFMRRTHPRVGDSTSSKLVILFHESVRTAYNCDCQPTLIHQNQQQKSKKVTHEQNGTRAAITQQTDPSAYQ